MILSENGTHELKSYLFSKLQPILLNDKDTNDQCYVLAVMDQPGNVSLADGLRERDTVRVRYYRDYIS